MKERLIVALDYPDAPQAVSMIEQLGETVSYYKVGLELFLNTRGEILPLLKEQGKKIFLDLKFHDIPNTVAAACAWAGSLGVDMYNVHASGGFEMMCRARESALEGAARAGLPMPKLIAVTLLTSLDETALEQVGIYDTSATQVQRLASLSRDAGLDGVVCSPKEITLVQKVTDRDFLTVCPGIRPLEATQDDQKRTMTPGEAVRAGVYHIVVGRPITRSEDPVRAAKRILAEMQAEEEG